MSIPLRPCLPARPGSHGTSRVAGMALALALAAGHAPSSWAEPAASQQEAAGANDDAKAAEDGTPSSVGETLGRIDDFLARLDTRIEGVRSRAEEMLDLADAATDPGEQMRLEELYGRMVALATSLEEQRLRLRTLRDELAAASERMPP